MKAASLILLIAINAICCFSQLSETDSNSAGNYYVSLRDKLAIYVYGVNKFNQLELKSPDNKNTLKYKPNDNFNMGIGFSYKWMGLGASFNFKFINKDDDVFGKTKSVDLSFDLYGSRMLWSGGLQTYQGYYWKNVDEYFSNWNKHDSVIIRPDITSVNLGINTIYSFNYKKYSFKSIYVNNEWQKRSAGSLLVGGYISLFGMSADSSLVPKTLTTIFPDYDSTLSLFSFNIGSAFGYTYTVVIHKYFYFSAVTMVGFSLQSMQALGPEEQEISSDFNISPKIHFRFATGYNSELNYCGVSVISDIYSISNKTKSDFGFNYGTIRIFYGHRFNFREK